ncbi:hypothetical protein OG897_25025 [Streptomyces sp. NBC_00237]|uniref:hypothetical protein n=1 Tax=Streptomyces sp. NBC_00237 TaxID=2975687 RepID=UPI00225967E1|nr:hypothetical protein [Streptomyces sp. NBC_00237]MCX5204705.1 hypothetical protein [Streptomyces sp. NBC_00237]
MAHANETPTPGPHIGSVSNSSLTFGANSTATTTNNTVAAQPDLLSEVRALREDLARLAATEPIEVLDAELVEAEAELTRTGRAPSPLLGRIGRALEASGPAATGFASAIALAQSIGTLLSGA